MTFISRDPLSGAEFSQGTNLYAYCGNNFLNASDPTGMCMKKLLQNAGAFLDGFSEGWEDEFKSGTEHTITAGVNGGIALNFGWDDTGINIGLTVGETEGASYSYTQNGTEKYDNNSVGYDASAKLGAGALGSVTAEASAAFTTQNQVPASIGVAVTVGPTGSSVSDSQSIEASTPNALTTPPQLSGSFTTSIGASEIAGAHFQIHFP